MHNDTLRHFSTIVETAAESLLAVTDAAASLPRRPGKWSPKEIIGHLIDSAVNNHARFVRARLQDDLVFAGYDQAGWVRVHRYAERAWPELVQAWRASNLEIAALMQRTPESELERLRPRHNLDEIAFQPPPDEGAATLGFLMRDYIAHMQHHLYQVLDA